MSSSDQFPHIPQTRDGVPNWAADTDPVGPVTPELALVDPRLSRGEINYEVTMSSMQYGDAQEPVEAQPAVPLQPLEPLVPAPPAPEAVPPAAVQQVSVEPASSVPVGDMRDVPLGTLVFRAGLLPEEHLEVALQEGMRTGRRLGEILLERRWVSETDLGRLLAAQKGLSFVELDPSTVDRTAPPLLHPEKARLHGALPIGFEGGVPVVAVADPSNDLVVENVRRALACEPVLVVAGRDALVRAIDEVYGAEAAAPAAEAFAPEQVVAAPVVEQTTASVAEPPYAPVVDEPAAVQPVAPVPPVEPVEPVLKGDGLWLGQPQDASVPAAVVPQAVPGVSVPQPAVVLEAEAMPVVPSAPAPVEPAAPQPEVVVEPTPESIAEPVPDGGIDLTWAVVLRLADGERLEVGSFAGEAEAVEGARAVVAQISTEGSWPFFAGRFIRPEGIVSVDLVELEFSRWLGSQARAAALGTQQPSA